MDADPSPSAVEQAQRVNLTPERRAKNIIEPNSDPCVHRQVYAADDRVFCASCGMRIFLRSLAGSPKFVPAPAIPPSDQNAGKTAREANGKTSNSRKGVLAAAEASYRRTERILNVSIGLFATLAACCMLVLLGVLRPASQPSLESVRAKNSRKLSQVLSERLAARIPSVPPDGATHAAPGWSEAVSSQALLEGSASDAAATLPPSLPDLIQRIKPSVVTIVTYDSNEQPAGLGTGFFVAPDSIVSNYHLLDGAAGALVVLADGSVHDVEGVSAEDAAGDLISLLVASLGLSMDPLPLAEAIPREGERVFVVGSPLGLAQTISDGLVSAYREFPSRGRLMQITAPVSPGSSGSPVVNQKGQVVGVATFQGVGAQNLNFAVPVDRVRTLEGERHFRTFAEWSSARSTGSAKAVSSTSRPRQPALLPSNSAFGGCYDYDVSGYSDSGEYVYGDVSVDRYGGEGYLYDDDGNEIDVDVDWTGPGEVEGFDSEGNYYDLEVE